MKPSLLDPRQRVVITGLGVVAPNGIGREAFWNACVEGRSGIDWIKSFDTTDLYCKIGGEVRDFEAGDYLDPKAARRVSRFGAFAVASARLAIADATIDMSRMDPYRLGTVFGTGGAGVGNVACEAYERVFRSGGRGLDVAAPVQAAAHASTLNVFIALGFRGHNTTCSAGCASGLDAIAQASAALRAGRADVIVAGGAEAPLSWASMTGMAASRVFTHHNDPPQAASRPYDDTRDGLVLSEGGGAVVLETAAHAMDRGAPIQAEVMGYATTAEAFHVLSSKTDGEELAHGFRSALLEAKISADEVDYVCAHGISSRDYDVAEVNAVKRALGDRAYHIPMSSIKSCTGQAFAAGGVWQTIAGCMAVGTGLVPPTINLRHPDPLCDLDHVPNYARRARVDCVMVNSHSLGGTHACLVIRRFAETSARDGGVTRSR
jgi:3-oxoacyl-[acyl-carrier-protein] synthase II